MSQTRIQDYGSPATAATLKTMLKSVLSTSGVLEGNDLTVVRSGAIQIAPGSCLTPEGVIIVENEYKEITVPDLSSQGNYTLYYSHEDDMISGGVPAILTIDSGFLTDVSGVILGYIQYDGSQLVQDQIIQPAKLKVGYTQNKIDSNWIFPLGHFGYLVTSSNVGPATVINITDTWEMVGDKYETYVKVKNNSDPLDVNRIGYITLTFPFKVFERPYALLQIIAGVSDGTFITLRFTDSLGKEIAFEIPPAQIFKSSLSLREFLFPETTTQNPNSVVYAHIDFQLGVGKEAKLQAIGLSPYNVPV